MTHFYEQDAIQDVLVNKVLLERDRQDAKWGTKFQGRPDEKWLAILMEEVGEAAQAALENEDKALEEEIIQCAAVCLAWLEFRTPRAEQVSWL